MIFLNSACSAAALVFYLPTLCTQTDTEGKQSSEYFEKFGKNTIFNEHPVSLPLLHGGLISYINVPESAYVCIFEKYNTFYHMHTKLVYLFCIQSKYSTPRLRLWGVKLNIEIGKITEKELHYKQNVTSLSLTISFIKPSSRFPC